jgi:hypothetical protein
MDRLERGEGARIVESAMARHVFRRLWLRFQYRGWRRKLLADYAARYGRCEPCGIAAIPGRKRTVEVVVHLRGGDIAQTVAVTDAVCPICGCVFATDVYDDVKHVHNRMTERFGG